MHLFGIPGIVTIFLGMLLGVYLSIERLVLDQQIGTRPLLWLTVLLIMVGTHFFGLGLLGEFLAHDNQSDRRTNLVSVREAIGIELSDVATNA